MTINTWEEYIERSIDVEPPQNLAELRDLVSAYMNVLQQARNIYENDQKNGIMKAIHSTFKFVHAVEPYSDKCDPFLLLHNILGDLDNGIPSPLLCVKKRIGRPRDPSTHSMIQMEAAATVSLLMDLGSTKEQAIKSVAGVLEKSGFPFRQKANPRRTVSYWRERLTDQNDKSYEPACYRYYYFKMKSGFGRWSPKETKKRLLEGLGASVSDFFGKKSS